MLLAGALDRFVGVVTKDAPSLEAAAHVVLAEGEAALHGASYDNRKGQGVGDPGWRKFGEDQGQSERRREGQGWRRHVQRAGSSSQMAVAKSSRLHLQAQVRRGQAWTLLELRRNFAYPQGLKAS